MLHRNNNNNKKEKKNDKVREKMGMMMGSRIDLDRWFFFSSRLVQDIVRLLLDIPLGTFSRPWFWACFNFFSTSARILSNSPRKEALFFSLFDFWFLIFIEKGGERYRKWGERKKRTYETRFWVQSKSRLTSLAARTPSAKLAWVALRRRWARACNSRISRCLAFSSPELNRSR